MIDFAGGVAVSVAFEKGQAFNAFIAGVVVGRLRCNLWFVPLSGKTQTTAREN